MLDYEGAGGDGGGDIFLKKSLTFRVEKGIRGSAEGGGRI